MRIRLAVFALTAALCATALPADADVYKWVDDTGSTHFADSPYGVPARYRDRVTVVRRDDDADADTGQDGADARAAGAANSGPYPEAEPSPFGLSVYEGTEADAPEMAEDGSLDEAALAAMLSEGDLPIDAVIEQFLSGFGALAVAGMLVALLLAFAFMVAISAVVLIKACSWAGVEPPGFLRAMGVTVIAGIASSVPGALVGAVGMATQDLGMILALNGLSFAASVAVQVAVYRAMLTETVGRAIVVWLMNLVIWIGVGIFFAAAGFLFAFC